MAMLRKQFKFKPVLPTAIIYILNSFALTMKRKWINIQFILKIFSSSRDYCLI